MSKPERYARFRGVRTEQVVRLEVNEGEGRKEDPIRRVVYWYTLDGHLIGHNDPQERLFRGEP